jgi:hypothetical protein
MAMGFPCFFGIYLWMRGGEIFGLGSMGFPVFQKPRIELYRKYAARVQHAFQYFQENSARVAKDSRKQVILTEGLVLDYEVCFAPRFGGHLAWRKSACGGRGRVGI